MTIDHIGAYLYPDELWFRAVGRVAFPIFLFLVGYSRSTKIDIGIVAVTILAVFTSLLAYYPVFPANILVSIIAARIFIRYLMSNEERKIPNHIPTIILGLVVWYIPAYVVFDYGTLALLFAYVGFVKRKVDDGEVEKKVYIAMLALSFITYLLLQQVDLRFSDLQFAFVLVGTAVTVYCLYGFKVKEVCISNPAIKLPMLFLSRYSLEYYVIHRAALQALSCFLVESHEHAFKWFNV